MLTHWYYAHFPSAFAYASKTQVRSKAELLNDGLARKSLPRLNNVKYNIENF
jgi:hypothetical protein